MSNVTFVTGLFDIGRGHLEGNFKRGFDTYLGWLSDLIEVINEPLVIFCDPNESEYMQEIREGYGASKVIPVDDLSDFKYFEQIQDIRNDPVWHHNVEWLATSPQALLPRYNPLVMAKQYWLNEVAWENPFGTEYFVWIDAGITNTTPLHLLKDNLGDRLKPYLDKLFYCGFPYHNGKEVHGFLQSGMDIIAGEPTNRVLRGTLFGGRGEAIKEITPLYDSLLKETLDQWLMGTEENIFTLLSYKYPEKFNVRMMKDHFVKEFLEEIR